MPAATKKTESKGLNWADEDDAGDTETKLADDDDAPLPEPETVINGNIKKVITYTRRDDKKVEKRTKIFRLEKRKVNVSHAVLERRTWEKFGKSRGLPPGPDNASTNVVTDDIFLTLSSKQEVKDDMDPNEKLDSLTGRSVVKCRYCGGDHWSTKCPYKENLHLQQKAEVVTEESGADNEESGTYKAPTGNSAGGVNEGGRYVPPRGRPGHGSSDRDETNTIRVTNLSENTREDDLRDLFRGYGPISRCYLATDRTTGHARGFAFISFHNRGDAQRAIDGVNGHGYDHLILQVEWAEDRKKD
eukprot:m.37045 g.37045  ORF g.37045 m.37045 type:complete len:302 (+) comp9236_c0_seq1:60-965(+)